MLCDYLKSVLFKIYILRFTFVYFNYYLNSVVPLE